jgi:hypothetical protein
MRYGTPNLEIHPSMRVLAQLSVVVDQSGTASAQRVEQFTTVNRCEKPDDD